MYTGHGKGKTTAALGLALRSWGRGMKVLIIQFIKSPERSYGERQAMEQLGIEMVQTGIGFTWTKTPEEHRDALRKAWSYTQEKVSSGAYDVIILDELNNALAIDRFPVEDVLPVQDVCHLIKQRPHGLHLVITGRHAREEIVELADLVTEMQPVKHYYEEGVPAVKGLEL